MVNLGNNYKKDNSKTSKHDMGIFMFLGIFECINGVRKPSIWKRLSKSAAEAFISIKNTSKIGVLSTEAAVIAIDFLKKETGDILTVIPLYCWRFLTIGIPRNYCSPFPLSLNMHIKPLSSWKSLRFKLKAAREQPRLKRKENCDPQYQDFKILS